MSIDRTNNKPGQFRIIIDKQKIPETKKRKEKLIKFI